MSKIPVYQTIETNIKKRIIRGDLKQGDMIQSENELKEVYKTSRMTVRQALSNLVNDGYLYRKKGKGTFVNTLKIEKKMQGLLGFTEEMRRINKKVKNRIIKFAIEPADSEVSAKLFLRPGEDVYYIERVRYGDDIPVLYEKLFIPKTIFNDLNQSVLENSFYDYVENTLNIKISYCMQSLEAKSASTIVSEMLEINRNSPILYMTRHTFLDRGYPFEYVKSYYRADQYRFVQHSVR
jgi:GntR family transcriptional regulator